MEHFAECKMSFIIDELKEWKHKKNEERKHILLLGHCHWLFQEPQKWQID